MIKKLFVLISLILSPYLWAQDQNKAEAPALKINLEMALQKALQNAPHLDVSQAELDLSEAQLQRAKAAFILPQFEVTVLAGVIPDLPEGYGPENDFPDYRPGVTNLGPFIRSKVTAVQPIFLFNKLKNIKKAAQKGVLAAENGLEAKKNEVIEQVQTVYWTNVYLKSVNEFINELLDRANQAKDRVVERLDSGSSEVTDIDLMRIKVFISETERRMADANRGLIISEYSLKLLMGLPSQQKIEIADDQLPKLKINLQNIEHYNERAKVARPEIQQLDNAVKAQNYITRSKKADFFPNIFIAGEWNYAEAPGRVEFFNPYINDGFNQNNGGASLGLRQNLSFFNISAAYKEEQVKLKLAQSKKTLALQAIDLDIRSKYLDLKAKQEAYESSKAALKSARSWVLSSTLNFGAGLLDARELLESFVGYASVKANFLEVLYNYNKSLYGLRRAVGEDIVKKQ